MRVTVIGAASAEEQKQYEKYIMDRLSRFNVDEIIVDISSDNDVISIKPNPDIYTKLNGCFAGNPALWNDAKRAEYRDHVCHPITDISIE